MKLTWILKSFSELTNNELYDSLALRTNVFVVEQNCPYPECDGEKDKKGFHLLGYLDDSVEAYLRIVPAGLSYKEVSIGRVVTSEKVRGKGVGVELMKEGINAIQKLYGNVPVRISAQEHLKKYYEVFGFTQVSEMYLEDNIPHIEMLKK